MLKETRPNHFESMPPLHHPGLYDDIEVPNLLRIGDEYYLIGSIREDAKIRYWHTHQIGKPWRSYYDNVLMAAGNYAGRVCRDDRGWLLWNFFSMDATDRTRHNLMPAPKRLSFPITADACWIIHLALRRFCVRSPIPSKAGFLFSPTAVSEVVETS